MRSPLRAVISLLVRPWTVDPVVRIVCMGDVVAMQGPAGTTRRDDFKLRCLPEASLPQLRPLHAM